MCEILERARKVQGDISYYEIAKRLNVSDQLVRKWKDNLSKPNGLNTLKLMELANIERDEAINLMQDGYIDISLLLVIAGSSLLYFSGITQLVANPHVIELLNAINVYYVE